MKVKHSKDVIKPQDDRTPDGVIHKALALWHLGHENRVCHIILERRRFSIERTLSCRLCIALVVALSRLVGTIGLPATCTLLEISLGEGGPS